MKPVTVNRASSPVKKSTFTANISGQVKRVTRDGRDYIVAPMTLLREGVLVLALLPVLFFWTSSSAARVAPESRNLDRLSHCFSLSRTSARGSLMSVHDLKQLKRSGIYQIKNLTNGKVYVGSAVCIRHRWGLHKRDLERGTHHSPRLQNAWNKYGSDSFVFLVIQFCRPERLIELEQRWIDKLSAADRKIGYNISPTAGSSMGIKRSAETRARLSASCKGRKLSEQHKRAIGESSKGRHPSFITRIKISQAKSRLKPSTRKKLRDAYSKQPLAVVEKRKAATAESNKLRVWTVAMRQKVRSSLLGTRHSEESKRKMSEYRKGRKKSLETRARMSEAAKLRWEAVKAAGRNCL